MSHESGLGNLEVIAEAVGPERVIGGITAHSGMPLSMNEVRYVGGLGPLLVIGPYDGVSRPGFEKLVRQFQEAGLDVHPTDEGRILVGQGGGGEKPAETLSHPSEQ